MTRKLDILEYYKSTLNERYILGENTASRML